MESIKECFFIFTSKIVVILQEIVHLNYSNLISHVSTVVGSLIS